MDWYHKYLVSLKRNYGASLSIRCLKILFSPWRSLILSQMRVLSYNHSMFFWGRIRDDMSFYQDEGKEEAAIRPECCGNALNLFRIAAFSFPYSP